MESEMKKTKNQTKYHKLQNTVLRSFTLLAVVLILIIGFVVGDRFINVAMGNYRTTAYAYTRSTASLIDGDAVRGYLESGEKDEYYYEIFREFHTMRIESVEYFVTSELVVSFKFVNSSYRDPFYGDSFYEGRFRKFF